MNTSPPARMPPRLSDAQAARIASVMTLGFSADPTARWVWPDPTIYATRFADFVWAYAGGAVTHGTLQADVDGNGFAMWLPPGVHAEEAPILDLMRETVEPSRLEEVFDLLGRMDAAHPPEPCWTLPLIAVDPMSQGLGLGTVIMRPVLSECDRAGLVACLDSSNPRNVPFYERLGFDVTSAISLDGREVMHSMLRQPR